MSVYDAAYHRLFGHPRMVEELLRDIIQPPWLHQLDLSTLTRVNVKWHGVGPKASGLRRREGDVLWRVETRDGVQW